MKQVLSVRSNILYEQKRGEETFELLPRLELVIVHTDGKNYTIGKKGFVASPRVSETRIVVSPELLQDLITDLQLHQKTLEGIRKNADQINSLVKHITEQP
jgi:hypothetical protein